MATEVTTRTLVTISTVESVPDQGIAQVPASLAHTVSYDSGTLATGTNANQQDRAWSDDNTVASGTPVSIDLAGTLTSKLDGSTVTFAEITKIWIENKSRTAGQVLEVGGGSNAFINWVKATGDIVQIGPGGVFLISSPIDGYAVTAATGDLLQLISSSGTIPYGILLEGRSV